LRLAAAILARMALKVFDLECENGHVFEGWFASHDDYDTQRERGLLTCPMCGAARVDKRVSAPRLNVGNLQESAPADPRAAQAAQVAHMQAEMMRQLREMLRKAENVGPRFAIEARRIHEGEAAERPIRGTATPDERAELAAEGIAVMELPDFLDDDRLQ
jgi:Uncharacterized protein conserved in bacteria